MIQKLRYTLFALLLLGIFRGPLSADQADELIRVMKIEQQMLGGFDAMLPMVNQLADQLSLDENEALELMAIYRTWFDEDIDRAMLIGETANLYRESFSEEEIAEMIRFFSSPVGQKVVTQSPILMQKGVALGMKEAQAKQEQLLHRLQPFFEKHAPKEPQGPASSPPPPPPPTL